MEILVLFTSRSGNVYKLAAGVAEGISTVDGVTPRLRRPQDITPIEIIRSVPAWAEFYDFVSAEVPEVSHDDVLETQGLAMGSPTRFGNIIPSMGNFVESLGPLWASGALIGKVGGVFTSTGTMHGGNESTLLTMMLPLMHLGYVIVPMGYTDAGVQHTDRGGTPYGPSSVSGPTADQGPSEVELQIARTWGTRLAEITKKLRA